MAEIYNLEFSSSTDDGGFLQPKFRGDRLADLMRERKISQSELGRRVGVSQATIWKLLNEPMQGTRFLHKIAEELGTTPAFLMGETDDQNGSVTGEMREIIEIEEMRLGDLALPVEQRAGAVARPFPSAWLAQITAGDPARLCAVRDLGNGMAPTIQNSDSVFLDRSITSASVADELFAIRHGGAVMIRRLRPRGEEIVIMSDRAEISDDHAPIGEIEILGRVAAIVRPA